MKNCWLPALLLLLFCACKKEVTYQIVDRTPEINLEISQVLNDSSLTLTWNNFTIKNLRSVKLIRQWEKIANAKFEYQNDVLLEANNTTNTTYHDQHTPFSYKTRYVIEVTTQEGNILYSNIVEHKRTQRIFQGFVNNILVDTSAKKLYTFAHPEGIITIIDYLTGTVLTTEQLDPNIGFCDLGTFNNEKELYVPTHDGWLDIRDAATLQIKDRIYVAGFKVSSVAAHNNQLFISTSDRTISGRYSGALKVYDRATKQLISRAGYSDAARIVVFPGSNTHIAEITFNLLPTQLCSYSFDQNGLLAGSKEDSYHGSFMLDGGIVKAFPNGRYAISSQQGNIIDSSLVLFGTIDDHSIFGYSDFEFSSDGNTIYAAKSMEPFIKNIAFPSLQSITTFNTSLPPVKIFRDGNKLYSISGDHPANISGSGIPLQFIIESFNL